MQSVDKEDRLQVINLLNDILRQYYSSHPDYLLRRARQYEAMCYKRANAKHAYFTAVNEGIYKIVVTYQKTHGTHIPPCRTQTLFLGTPVTPVVSTSLPSQPLNIPFPQTNYDGIQGVKNFLTTIGLTFHSVQHTNTVNASSPISSTLNQNNTITAPVVSSINQSTTSPISAPTPQTSNITIPQVTTTKTTLDTSQNRAKKRNSTNAGLHTPYPTPPPNRHNNHQSINNTNTLLTTTTNIPHQPILHTTPQPPQQTHQTPVQPTNDQIILDDGIQVSISQVYIAAMSIGQRLTPTIIRSLTTTQIIRLFIYARQVALSTAANLSNTHTSPAFTQFDPLALSFPPVTNPIAVATAQTDVVRERSAQLSTQQMEHLLNPAGLHPVPIYANTAQGTPTSNANIRDQQVETHNSSLYPIPQQHFSNTHIPSSGASHIAHNVSLQTNPVQDIPDYTGLQHAPSSATFQAPQVNRTSKTNQNQRPEGVPHGQPGTALHPSLSQTIPNTIDPAASSSFHQASVRLVILRLQCFQQKYRVYLKLVQDNLTALMTKGIQGLEGERYFRYMRYAVKLLTCPISMAYTITMEIIDKVESFLREYLVRYQGIALKRASNANRTNVVRGNSSGGTVPSTYATNVPTQVPLVAQACSVGQSIQLGANDSRVVQPEIPEMSNMMHVNASTAPATSSVQNLSTCQQAAGQATRNAAIRAVEIQREAMAQAGIRQAKANKNSRILSNRSTAEEVSPPAPGSSLKSNVEPGPETSLDPSATENRNITDHQLAQRVSRVNHYVRMAVHLTDGIKKNLENDRILRVREERIAEVCYVMDSEKKKKAQGTPSGQEMESSPEGSLMDTVKKECKDACEKHAKLILNIDEEWKRPVISCLLAYKSIRLPKMIVHVPATYKKKRCVTFGFERPPLGWVGIVGEVRKKFYAIREGEEGVSELLEAWISAAEELLKEE